MPDYTLYRVTITTLTPLHIGCGVTLLPGYDYAIHDGRTWRIDENGFLDAQNTSDPDLMERLAQAPPAHFLQEADFVPGSPSFRYVLQGAPRTGSQVTPIQAHIKDPFDRPYLPGSTLKGGLRTALGWQLWKDLGLKPEIRRLNRSPRWAAQDYERQIYGDSPNTDTLRALQVGDSAPVEADRLMILNTRGLARSGELGSPVEVEAVRPETRFTLELKLDLALFSEWARSHRLSLGGENALAILPGIVNERTLQRARREAAWYEGLPGGKRLASFYQQLSAIRPESNQFVLQLGFGTGWEEKTFGTRLSEDGRFMEQILGNPDYRLARGRRRSGSPFPSSRLIAVAMRKNPDGNTVEVPAYPLGWVLVSFELARGPQAWKSQRPAVAETVPAPQPTQPPPQPQAREREQRAPGRRTQPPTQAGQPRPAPAPQPVQPAAKPAEKPPAILRSFSGRPQTGQVFQAEVYDPGPRPAYITLPGLPDDLWTGIIPEPTRKLKEEETLLCEVIGMKPDPDKKGAWIVECRMV